MSLIHTHTKKTGFHFTISAAYLHILQCFKVCCWSVKNALGLKLPANTIEAFWFLFSSVRTESMNPRNMLGGRYDISPWT